MSKKPNDYLERDLLLTNGEVSASCLELLSSCSLAARASACLDDSIVTAVELIEAAAPTVDTVLDVSI